MVLGKRRERTAKRRPLFLKRVQMSHKSQCAEKKLQHTFHLWNNAKHWRFKMHDSSKLQKCYCKNVHNHGCYTTHLSWNVWLCSIEEELVWKINICEQKRHSVPTRIMYLGHDLISRSVRFRYQIYEPSLSKPLEGCLACIKVSNLTSSSLCLCFPYITSIFQQRFICALVLFTVIFFFLFNLSVSDLYHMGA